MEDLQEKMLDALVDTSRKADAGVKEAMDATMGAALQFVIIVSEVGGRNTLRDLYYVRRELTNIIKRYKDGTI